jgi:hypothetical protein
MCRCYLLSSQSQKLGFGSPQSWPSLLSLTDLPRTHLRNSVRPKGNVVDVTPYHPSQIVQSLRPFRAATALIVVILASCSPPPIDIFEDSGAVYFSIPMSESSVETVPEQSLVFRNDSTVIHTYITKIVTQAHDVSADVDGAYAGIQSKARYAIVGNRIVFSGWCNVSNPRIAAQFHNIDKQRPDSMEILKSADGAANLHTLAGKSAKGRRDGDADNKRSSMFTRLTTTMQHDARIRFRTASQTEIVDTNFPANYLPPNDCECKDAAISSASGAEQRKEERDDSVPDPLGTYVGPDDAVTITFHKQGRFIQVAYGISTEGSWRRVGPDVELSLPNTAPTLVALGEDFVNTKGMYFYKRKK